VSLKYGLGFPPVFGATGVIWTGPTLCVSFARYSDLLVENRKMLHPTCI